MTPTCLLILASTLFTEASTFNFNYASKTYDFQWTITFTPRGDDWLAVNSVIDNTFPQPLKLTHANLAPLIAMPQNPENTVAQLMSGWGVWTCAKSICQQLPSFVSVPFFHI